MVNCIACGPDSLFSPCSDIDGVDGLTMFNEQTTDFLLFNGALQDTSLNNGYIESVKLSKVAPDPAIQSNRTVGRNGNSDDDITIAVYCAHSTTGQTLDLELTYLVINDGDNVDTKATGGPVAATPVTPGTAYDEFVVTFVVPSSALGDNWELIVKMVCDVSGADTGDLYVRAVEFYQ